MSTSPLPDKMKLALAYPVPAVRVSALQPVAVISYQRIKATVLVINNQLNTFLVDVVHATDALAFRMSGHLADAFGGATDSLSIVLGHGAELDGAALNTSAMNE